MKGYKKIGRLAERECRGRKTDGRNEQNGRKGKKKVRKRRRQRVGKRGGKAKERSKGIE